LKTLLPVRGSDLLGAQRPRVFSAPAFDSSLGDEAVELALHAGLDLDPWQQFVIRQSLGLREDRRWAAFEVGLNVARQNGKDGTAEARELAGIFLIGEKLITHTAHQFDTSLEHFRRIEELIAGSPDVAKRVKKVDRAHGKEGIEFTTGQRIRFRTRTKKGGRGFSGDLVLFNEAMELTEASVGALMPTLSARPNPQLWYMGSAVDQEIHEDGLVFARVRARGLKGDDPSLAYFEWSIDADLPEFVTEDMATDPHAWAQANPGLGIRITSEYVANEQRSMDARTFAVERLGVGDWPQTDGGAARKIDPELWRKLTDPDSRRAGHVAFAIDVTPARTQGCIGVAGRRPDGRRHIEVVEHRRGTGWVADRALELQEKHESVGFVLDGSGPAASLLPALAERGVKVETVNAREHGQACGMLFDAAEQDDLRHRGTDQLNVAVAGASTRTVGDTWLWSRRESNIDISPLVACTLAVWGHETLELPDDSAGVIY
jgi:hypothetical protein